MLLVAARVRWQPKTPASDEQRTRLKQRLLYICYISYINSYFNPNHDVFLNPAEMFQWLKLTELPAYNEGDADILQLSDQ